MTYAVLSVDGACSGRRATCAAVLSIDGDTVGTGFKSIRRRLPKRECAVADDAVARTRGITGIPQVEFLDLEPMAPRKSQ